MQDIDYDKYDWPQFGPDIRQENFCKLSAKLREDTNQNLKTINISQGYPASSVDLGWLQDRILEVCKTLSEQDLTFNLCSKIINNVLKRAVQRLKTVSLRQLCEHAININFDTMDDSGNYDYDFTLILPFSLNQLEKENNISVSNDFEIDSFVFDYLKDIVFQEGDYILADVSRIYESDGVILYQVDTLHQNFCERCQKEESTLHSYIAWRMTSWKDPGRVHLCGNTVVGVRDLLLRTLLGWKNAIPPDAITPPWSDIPRDIDSMMSNNELLEEVIQYLRERSFDTHAALLEQMQLFINFGSEDFSVPEEDDEEA